MAGQELCHAKAAHLVVAEDPRHLLVGDEVLLVLGVLELVLLDVSPELLDALAPGRLPLADDVGKLVGEAVSLGQTCSLRHDVFGEILTKIPRYLSMCPYLKGSGIAMKRVLKPDLSK